MKCDCVSSEGTRRPKLVSRRSHVLKAIVLCSFCAVAVMSASPKRGNSQLDSRSQTGTAVNPITEDKASRSKVAEGEYVIYQGGNDGAIGPAGEEVYDFRESWSAWRRTDGEYDVEGVRSFDSPRDFLHEDPFTVRLSRDLAPTHITEFAKLLWRKDSGPITCELLAEEVHCSSGAEKPGDLIDLRIPTDFPYGFLWPISPFTLGGMVRQSERELAHPVPIQLISIEQPSSENPILTVTRTGQLQYLGEETIEAAGWNWHAHKFSLKVSGYPAFTVWTSSKGLLLDVTIEHADPDWPREQMKLVKFEEWTDFSGR